MPVLNELPYPLRAWSFRTHLIITIACFLFCCILVMIGTQITHNESFAPVFILPVILAGWYFKQRGAIICVCAIQIIFIVTNTLNVGRLLWPSPLFFGFIFGGLGFLVVGLLVGFLHSVLDISQQARLQAQQAEERQQQLNQIRNQFLLNINHELRTPLTQLQGYLELLRTFGEQIDAPARTQYLDHALEGCEELQLLIDNILDAAQADSGVKQPHCEIVPVALLIQDVLDLVDPQTREQYTIQLDLPEHLAVWADPQQSRQVIRNVLTNAFKYSPKQTTITITAGESHSSATSSQVCICIKDTGPGIPPNEINLLFEKFVRLQRDASGPTQGVGLGLYISKQLVEAMGGHIWVESTGIAGQGSNFYFTLPTASSYAEEAPLEVPVEHLT